MTSTSDLTGDHKFWLAAFPRGVILIGSSVAGVAVAVGGCCIGERAVHAYQQVRIVEIKAGIVQAIVDGAVAIVQTIVAGAI